jgi:protein gp37
LILRQTFSRIAWQPNDPMAAKTTIEWTESTWNPVTGCTKISPGCSHCYAERMANRLRAMGQPNYRNGFRVTVHPDTVETPLRWRRPQMVFVNSMSDLFHAHVPVDFILDLNSIMKQANWHVFQILTKRSERLVDCDSCIDWAENIWMGVTVENADYLHRIDHLRQCRARNRFISFEPLLGPVGRINLSKIDWVIVGGESGPGARPVLPEWVIDIKKQCIDQNVPFFFKQWGGVRKKKNGRVLEGKIYDAMPHAMTAMLSN